MRVVMRKFKEDTQWNVCGVFATADAADAQVAKEIESGREAKHFECTHGLLRTAVIAGLVNLIF